jgi:hypothetical protein
MQQALKCFRGKKKEYTCVNVQMHMYMCVLCVYGKNFKVNRNNVVWWCTPVIPASSKPPGW